MNWNTLILRHTPALLHVPYYLSLLAWFAGVLAYPSLATDNGYLFGMLRWFGAEVAATVFLVAWGSAAKALRD